jgi:hypothetical protein
MSLEFGKEPLVHVEQDVCEEILRHFWQIIGLKMHVGPSPTTRKLGLN